MELHPDKLSLRNTQTSWLDMLAQCCGGRRKSLTGPNPKVFTLSENRNANPSSKIGSCTSHSDHSVEKIRNRDAVQCGINSTHLFNKLHSYCESKYTLDLLGDIHHAQQSNCKLETLLEGLRKSSAAMSIQQSKQENDNQSKPTNSKTPPDATQATLANTSFSSSTPLNATNDEKRQFSPVTVRSPFIVPASKTVHVEKKSSFLPELCPTEEASQAVKDLPRLYNALETARRYRDTNLEQELLVQGIELCYMSSKFDEAFGFAMRVLFLSADSTSKESVAAERWISQISAAMNQRV